MSVLHWYYCSGLGTVTAMQPFQYCCSRQYHLGFIDLGNNGHAASQPMRIIRANVTPVQKHCTLLRYIVALQQAYDARLATTTRAYQGNHLWRGCPQPSFKVSVSFVTLSPYITCRPGPSPVHHKASAYSLRFPMTPTADLVPKLSHACLASWSGGAWINLLPDHSINSLAPTKMQQGSTAMELR